jgi:hypothetical protein
VCFVQQLNASIGEAFHVTPLRVQDTLLE